MKVAHLSADDAKDPEEPLVSNFSIDQKDLNEIVEAYRQRKLAEEIDKIVEIGGVNTIIDKLKSNRATGLSSSEDHKARIDAFGENLPPKETRMTYCEICWEALQDLTLRILIVCGIVSIIIGPIFEPNPSYAWIEGFAIIVAVVVVVNVTAINDLQKQKKFSDLKQVSKKGKAVSVLRDSTWNVVHPSVLLVGDIIKVDNGIGIPADGILIEAFEMKILEASITGENEQIKKLSFQEALAYKDEYFKTNSWLPDDGVDRHNKIPSPILLSGTKLAEGVGTMVVVAVGKNSVEGRIMELSEQDEEITPLMKKLNSLAEAIGKLGLLVSILTVLALYIRFIIQVVPDKFNKSTDPSRIVEYFIIGITVVVVAIPEGLPLAVTISLAYSIKKMQAENNLVKKMHACETMGGVNMICSDKTGTLTQNKMTVNEFWAGSALFNFDKNPPTSKKFQAEYFHLLKEGIFTNTSAFIDPTVGHHGNKTEIALLLLMLTLGHSDYNETRLHYFERFNKQFPFASERKKSSIVISLEDGRKRLHVKGAPEFLIKSCSSYLTADGNLIAMNDEGLDLVTTVIKSMTEKALRVIALAYKDIDLMEDFEKTDDRDFPLIEKENLILIGFAGIRDSIRDEVPEAVQKCQRAGITVRMITGDNSSTARAIAKECFIITSDEQIVIEGKEFSEITGGTVCKVCNTKVCDCPRTKKQKKLTGKPIRKDVVANFEAFRSIINNLAVVARSSPDDKYTLVCGLKQLGHVVAVTGDGSNDAPALKKADIGFAMGIAGTEMAKEAAGMILLDDNFNSIVRAVVWGRNIYDNIRCFIQFQLTVNLVAVISAVVGAITIEQSPLSSVQLLWVNLIMDSFASLALATDPPTDAHLLRKPYKRDEFIIVKTMWKHIIGQSLMQLTLMFCMMYIGEDFLPEYNGSKYIITNGDYVGIGRLYDFNGKVIYKDLYDNPDYGPSRHFTYIFNTFVMLQLMNEANCRKLRDELNIFDGIQRNWMFVVLWLGVFFIQVLIVQTTGYAFSCNFEGLSARQWLISIAFGCLSLVWRLGILMIPSKLFPEVTFI